MGKLKILIIIASFISVIQSVPMMSQTEQKPLMLGIFGAGTLNMHTGSFGTSEGILDCGNFSKANTLGWQAGNVMDYPLFGNFALSGRLFYYDARGKFNSDGPTYPQVYLGQNSYATLYTQQTLETTLDYVVIEALAKYSFTNVFYAALGPSLGYATRAMYNQSEHIVSPVGLTYTNGESTRKIIAGNFDETAGRNRLLRIGAQLALGADIPLRDWLYLNPEIGYTFGFTNIISGFDWKVNTLKAGIGLKFTLGKPEVIIKEIKEPEKPQQIKETPIAAVLPMPMAALQGKNKLADGSLLNYAVILVSDELVNDIIPILPYIFFASNSNTIPERYYMINPGETSSFNESNLKDSVIGVYHNVLNIVGDRMNRYPNSKLTITGCTDPLDDNTNNANLAMSRASVCKDYLTTVWKIDGNRINILSRALPEIPSSRNENDGREENRRAELFSDDSRVLEPVRINLRTSQIEPESIILYPNTQLKESVKSSELSIKDLNQNALFSKSSEAAPNDEITWNFNKEEIAKLSAIDTKNNFVNAELRLLAMNGQSVLSSLQIPIRRQISSRMFTGNLVKNVVVERYNVIFFDFDKPRISRFNEYVIPFVQQKMRTNSSVSITGYTDRLGPENHNLELSKQRADAITDAIKKRIIPEKIDCQGVGETLIYNNDIPEGRFYNRTVIIEISTPVTDEFFKGQGK
jgi:outer membrane protein OmpA-like peptidoglycan-associated protein